MSDVVRVAGNDDAGEAGHRRTMAGIDERVNSMPCHRNDRAVARAAAADKFWNEEPFARNGGIGRIRGSCGGWPGSIGGQDRQGSARVRAVPLVFAIHYHSAMVAVPKTRMNVNEYLAWALTQPGRYELVDGEVVAMSPESAGHAAVKFAVQRALLAGVQARRLPCHVLPDGMTVRIDEATAYEPDALVYCGATLPGAAIEVPNPVIVVEVLSRSTRRIDASAKLADYFRLPSVAHYLIVDPDKPLVVHHARGSGATILTRVVTQETIELDPPGLALTVDAIELLKTGDTKSWSVADHSINRP